MNRNTIVRIALPTALYEAVKGKVLNEAKAVKEEWIVWGRKGESDADIELGRYSDKAKAKKAQDEKWDADTKHTYSAMGVKKAKKDLKEISAQTKYNAAVKATQDAESEKAIGDDLFRAKRRQQAWAASTHINPAIESEARNIADMLTKSTGAAGFRTYIYKNNTESVPSVELIFRNKGNSDYYIEFVIKKNGTKVINQHYIPNDLERKLAVFVDKIRKSELDINTDDSTSSMNEAKRKSVKKPSAGMTKKKKSAVVKKAAAGEDIGSKGKDFEEVAAKAAKEYGSKEAGKKVAAAAMWKAQAGKKKVNEYDDYDEDDVPTPDGEYRNPNNRITNDDTYSVISYNSSRGTRLFTADTYQECKEFIEKELYGDFDDYGIFKN